MGLRNSGGEQGIHSWILNYIGDQRVAFMGFIFNNYDFITKTTVLCLKEPWK